MIGLAVSFIVFAAIIVLIIVFDGPKWIIPMLIIILIGEGYFLSSLFPHCVGGDGVMKCVNRKSRFKKSCGNMSR